MAATAQTRFSLLRSVALSALTAFSTLAPQAPAFAQVRRAAPSTAASHPTYAIFGATTYALPAGADVHNMGQPVYLTSEPGGVHRAVDASGKPINANGWTVNVDNTVNPDLLAQRHGSPDITDVQKANYGLKTLQTTPDGVITGMTPYAQAGAGQRGMPINGGEASIVHNGGDKPSYDVMDQAGHRVAASYPGDNNNIHFAGYGEKGDVHYEQDKNDKNKYYAKGNVNGKDCDVEITVHPYPKKEHEKRPEGNASANASAEASASATASVSVVIRQGSISQAGATAIVAGIIPNFTTINFGTSPDVFLHIPPGPNTPPPAPPEAPPAPPTTPPAISGCVVWPQDRAVGFSALGRNLAATHVKTYGGSWHIIDVNSNPIANLGNLKPCVDGSSFEYIGWGPTKGVTLKMDAQGNITYVSGKKSAAAEELLKNGVAAMQQVGPGANDPQAKAATATASPATAVGAPTQLAPQAVAVAPVVRATQHLSAQAYAIAYAKMFSHGAKTASGEFHGQDPDGRDVHIKVAFDPAGNITGGLLQNGKVSTFTGTFKNGELTLSRNLGVAGGYAVSVELKRLMEAAGTANAFGPHFDLASTITPIHVAAAAAPLPAAPPPAAQPAAPPPPPVQSIPAPESGFMHWWNGPHWWSTSSNDTRSGSQVASADAVTRSVAAIVEGMNNAANDLAIAQQAQRIDLGKQRAYVAFNGANAEITKITLRGKNLGRNGATFNYNTVTGKIVGEIRSAKAGVGDTTTYDSNGRVVYRSAADQAPVVNKALAKLRAQFAQSATLVADRTLRADPSARWQTSLPGEQRQPKRSRFNNLAA